MCDHHDSYFPELASYQPGASKDILAGPKDTFTGTFEKRDDTGERIDLNKLTGSQAFGVRKWQNDWLAGQGWQATPSEIEEATQEAIRTGKLPFNNY